MSSALQEPRQQHHHDDFAYPYDWRRSPCVINPDAPREPIVLPVKCSLTNKMTEEQIVVTTTRIVEQEIASHSGILSVKASPPSRRQAREMLRGPRFHLVLDFVCPRFMIRSSIVHAASETISQSLCNNYPLAISSIIIGITDETRATSLPMPAAELLVKTGDAHHIDNSHACIVSPAGRFEAAQRLQASMNSEHGAGAYSASKKNSAVDRRTKYSPPPPPDWLVQGEARKKAAEARTEAELQLRYEKQQQQLLLFHQTHHHHHSPLSSFSPSPIAPSSNRSVDHQHHHQRAGSLPPPALHARLRACTDPQRPLLLDRCGRCSKFDIDATLVVQQQKEKEQRLFREQVLKRAAMSSSAAVAHHQQTQREAEQERRAAAEAASAAAAQQLLLRQQISPIRARIRAHVVMNKVLLGSGMNSPQDHDASAPASSRNNVCDDEGLKRQREKAEGRCRHEETDAEERRSKHSICDPTIAALSEALAMVAKRQGLRSTFLLPPPPLAVAAEKKN